MKLPVVQLSGQPATIHCPLSLVAGCPRSHFRDLGFHDAQAELPAETFAFLATHQVPPNLLFHPVFDKREDLTGVPYRKVVHPPTQNGIDQLNHPPHGLADMSAEDVLELSQ